MENQTHITPFTKYFAMILFILLPFVGGWIGYELAPEKVVEVEKITYVEPEANEPEIDVPVEDRLEANASADVELVVGYPDFAGSYSGNTVVNEDGTYTMTTAEEGVFVLQDFGSSVYVTDSPVDRQTSILASVELSTGDSVCLTQTFNHYLLKGLKVYGYHQYKEEDVVNKIGLCNNQDTAVIISNPDLNTLLLDLLNYRDDPTELVTLSETETGIVASITKLGMIAEVSEFVFSSTNYTEL